MDSLTRAGRSRGGLDEAGLDRVHAVGLGEGSAEGLVRQVLTATLDVVPCEHSLLLTRTETGGFRLHTALDDGALIGMPFNESDTILSQGLEARRPIVVEAVAERDDAGDILTRMFRARRLTIVPLRVGEEVLGALGAVDPIDGTFSDEDHRLLSLLAQRAAVALSWLGALDRARAEVEDAELLLQRLYGSDRSKTELLSVVSHEVKGPVTNVVGFGQLLRRDWAGIPADKRDHFLDLMVREGQRAARLVEDILDLARLESGSLSCDLRAVDLRDVVADVVTASEVTSDDHEVVVELDEELPTVLADPDRVAQVIRNLLSNACNYSPPGSRVNVRALRLRTDDGADVLVSVTDEGPGIPEFEQGDLFERFRRLSTSHGRSKGSGLGLYISRGIVEAHGGRIWVRSQPGRGTTFYFTLRRA